MNQLQEQTIICLLADICNMVLTLNEYEANQELQNLVQVAAELLEEVSQ